MQFALFDVLLIAPSKKALFLTEQITFESLAAAKLHVNNQNVLALYASGRTTGVTVCCGHEQVTSAPIYEGYALPHSVTRCAFGGKQLTEALQRETRVDFASAEQMKKDLCRFDADEAAAAQATVQYMLPDGECMAIKQDALRKCAEAMFDPSLLGFEDDGVHQVCSASIWKNGVSIRKDLIRNVLVHGGASMMRGFAQRMQTALTAQCATSALKVNVLAPAERQYSSWIGGSILSPPVAKSAMKFLESCADVFNTFSK